METFVDIEGYNGGYRISNQGRIWSSKTSIYLLDWKDKDGYKKVNLVHNGVRTHFSIHRLVATYFVPNPDNKPVINHKDGDKQNNNDWNLEWATRSENDLHAYATGLRKPPRTAFKKGHIPWHKKS